MTKVTIPREEYDQLLKERDMLKACQERSALLKELVDMAAAAMGAPYGEAFSVGPFSVACQTTASLLASKWVLEREVKRLSEEVESYRGSLTFVDLSIDGPRSGELMARLLEVLGPARTQFKDWTAAEIIERLKRAYHESHAGVLTTTVRDIIEAYEKDPDNAAG